MSLETLYLQLSKLLILEYKITNLQLKWIYQLLLIFIINQY